MSSRTQYLFTETAISVVINGVLSTAFVFLIFHGQSRVVAGGRHGIIVDMAPQTFMVTLMACLVPSLLTRRRHATGKLAWHKPFPRTLLSSLWFRASGTAILATDTVIVFAAATFPHLFPGGVRFASLLIGKILFVMALASIVTPWAITRVLR